MKTESYLHFWGTEQWPNYLGIKILGKLYYITCNPIYFLFGSKSMWDLLPNQYTWDCHLTAVPRCHVFWLHSWYSRGNINLRWEVRVDIVGLVPYRSKASLPSESSSTPGDFTSTSRVLNSHSAPNAASRPRSFRSSSASAPVKWVSINLPGGLMERRIKRQRQSGQSASGEEQQKKWLTCSSLSFLLSQTLAL